MQLCTVAYLRQSLIRETEVPGYFTGILADANGMPLCILILGLEHIGEEYESVDRGFLKRHFPQLVLDGDGGRLGEVEQ
ncbi:MAG: hypothetical protein AMS17_14095 [Spirochaetes bacterium DG_61]|nr:MAG: hypothetical protein AMS17_14095 [Spirochaetes bacterium DG_61]